MHEPRGVRWGSVALVLGGSVIVLVCLGAVLRGRVWAAVPALVVAAVVLREVRGLQRGRPAGRQRGMR